MPGPLSAGTAYHPIGHDDEDMPSSPAPEMHKPAVPRRAYWAFLAAFLGCLVLCLGFSGFGQHLGLTIPGARTQSDDCPCRPSDVPQYFQTSPQLWAGPTATGKAAFLAQTVAFDPAATYVPNEPLRTSMPIVGMGAQDEGIFKLMGCVSRVKYYYVMFEAYTARLLATYPRIHHPPVSEWMSTHCPLAPISSKSRCCLGMGLAILPVGLMFMISGRNLPILLASSKLKGRWLSSTTGSINWVPRFSSQRVSNSAAFPST